MSTEDHSGVRSSTPGSDWPGRLARLLILVGIAVQLARIFLVESASGELPFLSANDRSRWCTIAALVSQGTYQIDAYIFEDGNPGRRSAWYSIDVVRHRGADGQLHYYSSKPPLLPTLYAGVYWLIRTATGWDLLHEPFAVARSMLILVNLVPLVIFWWAFLKWFSWRVEDPWSNLVMACMVVLGTFLSTFVITLNNHLPAAMGIALSVWCLDRIAIRNDRRWRWFVLCGLGTSFGAANELPALSWVAAAGAVLMFVAPKGTLLGYLPALLPVALGFFGTNYLAHGELAPAYAHRDAGEKLFEFETAQAGQLQVAEVIAALQAHGIYASQSGSLRPARREFTFEFLDEVNQRQFALRVPRDAGRTVALHEWGDWYDYPGSYWAGPKQGVDQGEPSRVTYAFHCLVGHHGILSLTPFWLLSILGGLLVWERRKTVNIFRDPHLLAAAAMLATTAVVLAFYISRDLEDRNYGGMTSGLRWTFWLIPLWLWLASQSFYGSLPRYRSIRVAIEVLVAISVFSAVFPWGNPWTAPWLERVLSYIGAS